MGETSFDTLVFVKTNIMLIIESFQNPHYLVKKIMTKEICILVYNFKETLMDRKDL